MAAVYEQDGELKQMLMFNVGDHFGELPLMLGIACPTTMMAVTNTVLFVLPQERFQQLLQQHPSLADDIAAAIAQRQDIIAQHQEASRQSNSAGTNGAGDWIRDRLQRLLGWGKA